MARLSAKKSIVRYGRLLYQNGFVAGYDGNLSLRTKSGNIIITPTLSAKGFLRETDLILLTKDGKKISGKKKESSESTMHVMVYKARPEINACCHAHPPYATAFASTGSPLPVDFLPEAVVHVGRIPLVPYIPTGEKKMWAKFEKYIPASNAYLLGNHGVLAIGRTMDESYYRMETVEHLAKIAYIGQAIGKLKPLDSKEINRLLKIGESIFGKRK
jgi:L-fuculose-phosphate aldolase